MCLALARYLSWAGRAAHLEAVRRLQSARPPAQPEEGISVQFGDPLELLFILVALVFVGIRWLYRKQRARPSSRSSSTSPSEPNPPTAISRPPATPLDIRRIALASVVAVFSGYLASAIWIIPRVGANPDRDSAIALLTAVSVCLSALLLAALVVLATSALNNVLTEFQGKPLSGPLGFSVAFLLGLFLGTIAYPFILSIR